MACSTITLNKGINGKCDASVGGIVEVYITNYPDAGKIFTMKNAEGTEETDIVKAVSAEADVDAAVKWYKFSFRKGTSYMNSTLTVDDANGVNYVTTELQMLFSKMEINKRVSISALTLGEFNIVVKDSNGYYWALGVSEAVTVSAGDGQTGTAKSDSNRYSITLTDDCPVFPLPLTNGDDVAEAAIYE